MSEEFKPVMHLFSPYKPHGKYLVQLRNKLDQCKAPSVEEELEILRREYDKTIDNRYRSVPITFEMYLKSRECHCYRHKAEVIGVTV